MKKPVKYFLIAISSLAGIVIILMGLLLLKFKLEAREMSPMNTGLIIPGIYVIKDGFSNVYLIQSNKKLNQYITVDAGNNPDNLSEEMRKINIEPGQVTAVYLTHSDGDHIGGLELFKKATIYLAPEEIQMINGQKNRLLIFKNKLKFPFRTFHDGRIMKLENGEIQSILIPGHTPGSTCYLVQGKYLFTGDNLKLKNNKIYPFNDFFNMDTALQLQSLEKLKNLKGIKAIFTAHYGMFQSDTQVNFEINSKE